MDLHKIVLCICAIILVSLSVLSEGGKRPRGKKYPVKPLFGVGLGYRKIVSYKPVLVFQKHKHHKIRHHHGGWGWGGWGGHHGHGHHGHGHGGHGHGHGGHGHGGGHGKGHGGGHGGWASSYQGHHDGWSRGGGPGWGWDDEMGYDDPHEHYGGWESSLTSLNLTAEAPSHNNEDVNHSPISTRPETHINDNLSNHNAHNQGKIPFNEAHLNENLRLHPHHRNSNDNNRDGVENNSRNRNNGKNQAPDHGQHHPLIQRDERLPHELIPYREDDRQFFAAENAKKSEEEMREERFVRNFHRQNHDDPFHNFHNSDFLRRRRHQKSKGSRRRDSIQDVLAGGSENFDVIYMNEKKDGGHREGIQKNPLEDEKSSGEINPNQKSSKEFDVNPLRMEFITTPSSFFSTTAFPTFNEFRRKRISA